MDRSVTKSYKGLCLHCSHRSEDEQWYPLPVEIRNGEMMVFGWFCTPGCAWAYIQYALPEIRRDECSSLLHSYLLLNLRKQVVRPNPPRHKLKMYGGEMDIKEFRSKGGVRDWVQPEEVFNESKVKRTFIGAQRGKAYVLKRVSRLPGVRLLRER